MGKENVNNWKDRLATFDFEVTAHDWLLVIKDYVTKEYFVFHNDPFAVETFLNERDDILVGYNNKHYDNYILKGLLNHYQPDMIKDINDFIIRDHGNGWEYPYDMPFAVIPPTCDLMLDMPLRQSLKELEGNMKMDIRESTIDFNIDHPWTEEEFEEMVYYCKHDVDSTERLIDERMSYMESKIALGELCGLSIEESLYRTNAQLAAKSLGAEKQEHNDYHDYVFPPEVKKEVIPEDIIRFIDKFRTVDESELKEDNMKLQWKGDIAGVPHVIGLGGIHGAIKNYQEKSNDERIIVNYDVTSYYPSLLIQYHYLSRNVSDPSIYENYYHERVEAKKNGDKKKANGLKLVLNTTYGASLQKFNDLYDPLMGVSTCLTGQLLLTQLITTLQAHIESFQLIQSNTDGIMFSLRRDELETARGIVKEWSELTRLGMEEDQINMVVQKDVNNYLIEMPDGSLKYKGGYVSDYPNGSFTHNSMSIVAEAIIKYFTEDKPVEDTIMECNEPTRFQLIAKTGYTYDKTVHYVNNEEVIVQKVNRLYAVADTSYGVVKKVKKQYLTLDEDGERRYYINQKGARTYKKKWDTDNGGDYFVRKDTTQNCPDHAIIDNSCQITIDTIDKEWYINLANKRINDFLGIKEKKEKKKMATKKTEVSVFNADGTINEPLARIQLYKKIEGVGNYLSQQGYIADGYNQNQDYEYVSSHHYRELLGKACREVGLVFKMNIANRQFEKLEATKNMNLTTIYGTMCFIDPETGMHEDYTFLADGSDNMDKGIYKAETMAIKYFVMNNFLLPKQQDEIDPESGKGEKSATKKEPVKITESAPKKPATPQQREEAKQEVVNDKNATPEFITQIIGAMDKIRTVKGEGYGKKTYDNLQKALNGDIELPKTEAVKLMNTFEERMDELGLE